MAAQFEKPRDVVGGLLVAAIGAAFLLEGRDLRLGTSFRMGPGYFPTILSYMMITLGVVITVLALRKPPEEGSVGRLPWVGIALVTLATIFFGLTLRGLGLAPAVAIVVLATAWGSRYATLRASIPLALGLAAFCAALFIRGLGLPLPLFGPWLSPAQWTAAPPAAPAAPAAAPPDAGGTGTPEPAAPAAPAPAAPAPPAAQ